MTSAAGFPTGSGPGTSGERVAVADVPVERRSASGPQGGALSLGGVMVALLTPVTDEGSVDHQALDGLVRSLMAAGVAGISPLGSTGEGASLTAADRLAVLDTVLAAVPPGTPVVPGSFRDAFGDAVDDLIAYADHGASAVLVAPPHYFAFGATDLRRYFEALAERAPLPMVLYNIPSFTRNALPPPVLAAVVGHPRVAGVKDSSRDVEYLLQLVDALGDAAVGADEFVVMTGTDTMLLASLGAGARGAIVASANLVPELPVGVHRAWTAGRHDEAARLERRLRQVVDACRVGTFPAGWKAAVALTGRCGPWLVPPRVELGEPERARLQERLVELGVLGDGDGDGDGSTAGAR